MILLFSFCPVRLCRAESGKQMVPYGFHGIDIPIIISAMILVTQYSPANMAPAHPVCPCILDFQTKNMYNPRQYYILRREYEL